MVEVDADDRRRHGVRHVGGVEPAAEAHLDDGHVDARPAEVREGGGGQHLEEGGVRVEDAAAHEARRRVPHRPHRPREVAVRDRAAVDRDPLVDAHEVGRRVAAGAQARGAQDRVAVGRDRALAVRARDEQRRARALGVPHLGHERAHRLEPELHPEAHPLREVEAGDAVGGEARHGRRAYQRRRDLEISTRRTANGRAHGPSGTGGPGARAPGSKAGNSLGFTGAFPGVLDDGVPGAGFHRGFPKRTWRETDNGNGQRTDQDLAGLRPARGGCGKVEESVEYF